MMRCSVLLLALCAIAITAADDLQTIKSLWSNWLLASVDTKSAVYWTQVYNASILPNGSWADVDYTDPNTEIWTTLEHLTRILFMAEAYNTPSMYLHDASLLTTIELAISYWLKTNPLNSNWYQNQFVVPTFFGQIEMLVGDVLPNSVTQEILETQLSKTGACTSWTGANRVMCSNIHALIGAVYNNLTQLTYGITQMYSILVIEPGILEGIKQDASYFQHGNQLYSGKYGNNVTQDILVMIYLTKNTSFSITAEQLSIFAMHVLDGQQWMIAGPSFDYGVVGRAIARPWTIECTFPPYLVGQVGGARAREWTEFAERLENNSANPLYGHRHYWKGDYTAHRAQNYYAYVKMFSNRTYNTECVNFENKEGLHISDGSLQLYKTGQEFEFVFVAWDFEKPPGTTVALGAQVLECTQVKALGIYPYVGGVSDTYFGSSAMEFHSVFGGQLYLKKSWFFFPDIIVNLGTDIQFPLKNPVVTTLNQCLLTSDVYISSQSEVLSNGTRTLNDIWWVHHNNVAYVFSEGLPVTVQNQAKNGSYPEIGDFEGNVTRDIFAVWINHPTSPLINGSYQYFVIPDIAIADMPNIKPLLAGTQIISNTPLIQAVFQNDTQLFQIIFYDAGTVSAGNGFTVSADGPLAVMVRATSTFVQFTVSDPTQNPGRSTAQITLDRALQGGCCSTVNSGESVAKITLPGGEFSGSSVQCQCNLA